MSILSLKDISDLSKNQLISLVEHGIVKVVMTDKIPDETIEIPEPYSSLVGHPINIGAAARKYNVAQPTISRWVKAGFIPVLGVAGQKKLIDEGHIAYRAFLYHKNPGQGKRNFERK